MPDERRKALANWRRTGRELAVKITVPDERRKVLANWRRRLTAEASGGRSGAAEI